MNLLNKLLKLFRRDFREKHADLIQRAEARGFKIVRFSDFTWGVKNTNRNEYVDLENPRCELTFRHPCFEHCKTKRTETLITVLEILTLCEIDDKGNR